MTEPSARHQQYFDTAMRAAFLKALARRAAHGPNPSTQITLPTGAADIGEIALVLRALALVRDRRAGEIK